MNLPWKEGNNLSGNAHVRSIIYLEFYYGIVYIAQEGRYLVIE